MGDERIVGFYIDKEDAFKNVKENDCNINNTYYNYALIEEVEEGLRNPAGCSNRWFFKYNKETDEYDEIEEPTFLNGFSGFTIG